MPKLDTAKQKTVIEMLKNSKDVEIYNLSAFAGDSDILKCMSDVKTVLTKNKGKDVTIITSVR
jgi:hypothetical protein